jgi:hypothetical protein
MWEEAAQNARLKEFVKPNRNNGVVFVAYRYAPARGSGFTGMKSAVTRFAREVFVPSGAAENCL